MLAIVITAVIGALILTIVILAWLLGQMRDKKDRLTYLLGQAQSSTRKAERQVKVLLDTTQQSLNNTERALDVRESLQAMSLQLQAIFDQIHTPQQARHARDFTVVPEEYVA